MESGNVQRVKSTHGKACDGSVCFVGLYPIVAFDKLDDVAESTLIGTIHGFWDHELGFVEVLISLSRGGILNHVTIWHHHDHRLGFSLSDQIVHDLSSTP